MNGQRAIISHLLLRRFPLVSADHVLEQLRLIRAENDKRDREFSLMRAEFTVFRTQLEMIVRLLGTHTDILQEINDRLLALQRERGGIDG